ncbi:MAG: hypothetical protein E7657_07350 [Ruminococcaceae bacterium]|nr:hypothetical protein [Oscillospiraceae bacterium]
MAKNKKTLVGRIGNKCKTLFTALTNPRFLLCFGIAWMLTNGWAYVFLGVGAFYEIDWMTAVGAAYMAFLWYNISVALYRAKRYSQLCLFLL